MTRPRVLILCTHNSARGQMAEGAHWSFEDPAAAAGSETERLAAFRDVRDRITERLRTWLAVELIAA